VAQQGQAANLWCQASLEISESLAPDEAIFSNFLAYFGVPLCKSRVIEEIL
jgi:hypothetical protein